jgi:hypothetical protein
MALVVNLLLHFMCPSQVAQQGMAFLCGTNVVSWLPTLVETRATGTTLACAQRDQEYLMARYQVGWELLKVDRVRALSQALKLSESDVAMALFKTYKSVYTPQQQQWEFMNAGAGQELSLDDWVRKLASITATQLARRADEMQQLGSVYRLRATVPVLEPRPLNPRECCDAAAPSFSALPPRL